MELLAFFGQTEGRRLLLEQITQIKRFCGIVDFTVFDNSGFLHDTHCLVGRNFFVANLPPPSLRIDLDAFTCGANVTINRLIGVLNFGLVLLNTFDLLRWRQQFKSLFIQRPTRSCLLYTSPSPRD